MEQHMKWTMDQVPNLTGKIFVVTGANSGIGFETARACAEHGAHTILACRNEEKGARAVTQLNQSHIRGKVENMKLDLGSLSSISEFANELLNRHKKIDGLINNAGIMMPPYQLTVDGFESQFGINHLGHFALTGLILPALLTTPNSRIVNVSSGAHGIGTMDFENLLFTNGKGYSRISGYGRSKLANLLFTKGLQKRLKAIGSSVIATSAHPGWSSTNLGKGSHLLAGPIISVFGKLLAQSSAMGALPTLRALLDQEALAGDYYGPDGFRESRGYPIKVSSSKVGSSNVGANKAGTLKVGESKVGTNKLSTLKGGASKVGATKVDSSKVGILKDGITQVGVSNLGTLQGGSTQVDSTKVSNTKSGPIKIDPTKVCSIEISSMKVGSTKIGFI